MNAGTFYYQRPGPFVGGEVPTPFPRCCSTGDSVAIAPWRYKLGASRTVSIIMPAEYRIYTISSVIDEVQQDKFGRSYKLGFTEEYVDEDGILCTGMPVLVYNEDLWASFVEGAKVRRKPQD